MEWAHMMRQEQQFSMYFGIFQRKKLSLMKVGNVIVLHPQLELSPHCEGLNGGNNLYCQVLGLR